MEIWDLFNEDRQPTMQTHRRGDPMKHGDYHIVVAVWTVNRNNEILMTLRHPDKDYPNMWENTAGSILTGETSRQGAIRELFEETGIQASEDDLTYLGTRKEETAFVDTYIHRKDIMLTELTLQDGETVDAQWVTIDRLDELIGQDAIPMPVVHRLQLLRSQFEAFLFSEPATT
jgi:8-oxo-dGTP pyrophosphatase MutT (NUDIX family)